MITMTNATNIQLDYQSSTTESRFTERRESTLAASIALVTKRLTHAAAAGRAKPTSERCQLARNSRCRPVIDLTPK